jgi:multicomponent Na+:H+ antiporter subunit B
MLELHLIMFFMIAAAIIAVEVKDLLSSVVAIGAVGIGLCMAFLALKAPDLAIMQLVVEILSLVILIRATSRKDLPFSASGRWAFNTVSTLAFIAVFLVFGYFALNNMHPFGRPDMRVSQIYLDEAVGLTGALNVVDSISLNFRAVDSLGEVVVVFTAVIGVLAIARRVGHKKEL